MMARNDRTGKFAKGNVGGPGNPYAKKALHFKTLIHECVTDQDFRDLIASMLLKAKAGNMLAARELLDRLCGKPEQTFVDGSPEKPPLSFEEVLKNVFMIAEQYGFKPPEGFKCPTSTSTILPNSSISELQTPSAESTSATPTTSAEPSPTPPPL